MKKEDLKIKELEDKIINLPQGYITKKNINGKMYYYHRFKEDNKLIEKYIDFSLLENLKSQIELRRELKKELELLKDKSNVKKTKKDISFRCNILVKEELRNFVNIVKDYKKRKCYNKINEYLYNDVYNKVLILYGLRRTGKTTLIRQSIYNMNEVAFLQSAFIQITPNVTLVDLNKDLRDLALLGFKYIFIDEVTLLEDFIEGAALLSDIYVNSGMKIILSGTDSLGFIFANSDQLFDRNILVHTTFIPYKEFENVLNIKGIDEYIRYGGTMSLSGKKYNDYYIFDDKKSVDEYVDSAIAKNIQHSLRYYQNGTHFRNLKELYDKNELTNVINRIVEDINHRFTKEIITKKFKSNDLAISSRNLRNDAKNQILILDEIDQDTFTEHLKDMLEVLDKEEQKVKIKDDHLKEIKEYLRMIDIIYEIDVKSFPNINNIKKNIIITQPGLRFVQASSLVNSLLLDEKFTKLSIFEIQYIISRVIGEIKGRMMEDIILLETKMANSNKEVFKLQFAVGEFDMVIADIPNRSCEIYEIKYSKEAVANQYRFLKEEEKLRLTSHRFGNIVKKGVIYRGKSCMIDDINYINVEEYLKNI